MNGIRLGAVYGVPPLFRADVDSMGYFDAASLGLSANLQSKIAEWDQAFQETFCADYPPDSGFPSEEALVAHNVRGRDLERRIKAELGPQMSIEFIPLKQ